MEQALSEVVPALSADARRPGMSDLVAMEALKLRMRLMTKVVFAIVTAGTAALMVVAYIATRSTSFDSQADRDDQISAFLLPEALANGSEVIRALGSILLVVLAAAMVGSEFGWGTIRVLVSSGVSRSRLLAAKLIALGGAVVLFVLAGMAATAIASVGVTVAGGHDLGFAWLTGATLADILLIAVRLTLLLLVPAMLAFTVSVLTRSLAAGIAIGIGFQIVEQIVGAILGALGGVGETLQDLLIQTNLSAIAELNEIGAVERSSSLPNPWQASGVLVLYCAVMLAASFAVFRHRDMTAGG
jgi:ABC-type transport system involved in multi-copper enzyme maturation permease subunit